ncbi:hypothetical protein F5884DRAFT_661486 [Xylogone sp. PMI_703]|nr:hypothetical protein F5884DRAFT_661486 [Xylogone sp. PMI_703]
MTRPTYGVPYTKSFHRKSYAAIDSAQPALSAAGKTILITAGHTGIGFAISQNFAIAGASNIIIVARRPEVLEKAVKELSAAHPKTKFHYFAASIDDEPKIKEVFAKVRATIADIDILVTSAAYVAQFSDTIDLPVDQLHGTFQTNVFANINLVKEFLANIPEKGSGKEKIILDLSSSGGHLLSQKFATYGISKTTFTRWLQHVQADLKDKAVRVHSFHPGGIFTDAVKSVGMTEEALEWDDVQLPGNFAVWLASKEAAFLAGRFVWANWDVEELKARKAEIENDPELLTIGLISE